MSIRGDFLKAGSSRRKVYCGETHLEARIGLPATFTRAGGALPFHHQAEQAASSASPAGIVSIEVCVHQAVWVLLAARRRRQINIHVNRITSALHSNCRSSLTLMIGKDPRSPPRYLAVLRQRRESPNRYLHQHCWIGFAVVARARFAHGLCDLASSFTDGADLCRWMKVHSSGVRFLERHLDGLFVTIAGGDAQIFARAAHVQVSAGSTAPERKSASRSPEKAERQHQNP